MMSIPQKLQYQFKDGHALHTLGYIGPVVDRFLAESASKGSRVIDLGCGNGGASGRLIANGYRVTGIDPSEKGIALARESYPEGSWHISLAQPGLIATMGLEPFDAALSIEVVEHVYSPRDWATCCFESIRPGGTLICSTPYHGYLKNLALSITDRWDRHMNPLWDGGHIKLWSRKTLSKLLTEAGFTDLRFAGAGRLPGLWMSMIFAATRPE